MHGGVIGVISEGTGRGSCFFFELPCHESDLTMGRCPSAVIRSSASLYSLGGATDIEDATPHNSSISSNNLTSFETTNSSLAPAITNMVRSAFTSRSRNTMSFFQEENTVKKYRILVADDVALIRNMMQRSLVEMTDVFDHAYDGENAIEFVKAKGINYYDIILLDGYMPRVRQGLFEIFFFLKHIIDEWLCCC